MNSLPTKLLWLACLSMLATSAVSRDVQVIETALETSTDLAALPTSVPTVVTARACASCEGHVLRVNEKTRFFTKGKAPASLAQLNKTCGAKTAKVGVFFDLKTKVITRIVTDC
jgi:hypothetical protein